MEDVNNLQRFVDAQNQDFEGIVEELESGQKRGHWMWFVFPQIKGLGRSEVAERFAIRSQKEAAAYLKHSILGTRLRQCTQLVINIEGLNIEEIFHSPDHLKFHSSMTLFAVSSNDNELFIEALNKYYMGRHDKITLDILRSLEHCGGNIL